MYFFLMLLTLSLSACVNKTEQNISKSKTQEEINVSVNEGVEIDWNSIPIDTIFFRYPYNKTSELRTWEYDIDKFFNHEGLINKKNNIDYLFNDSTILENTFFYSGHPNKNKGYFFKRLSDIGKNRVLLFVSLDTDSDLEGGMKPISIEIQIFDKENICIDKMIVYEVIPNECTWNRVFEYQRKNILKIQDRLFCIDINASTRENNVLSDSSVIYYNQIKENGKIVRHYDKSNGFYNDLSFKEKGLIKNHYKEGLWQKNIYSEYNQLDGVYFIMYHEGEKDGEALYYTYEHKRIWEGLSLEYGEKYQDNHLVSNTMDTGLDPEKFSIYQKCDSIIESIGINKSVERVLDE